MTTWAWIVAGIAVAALAACGKDSRASGLNGRFRAQTPQGGQDMVLAQSGSEVKVTMNGEDVTGRVVSPGRVEGSKSDAEGVLSFVLVLEGADRLRATFAIQPTGGPRAELPEMTFDRVKEDTSAGGTREAELVGHWRNTDVLGEGSGPRLVTDTHLVLQADGRYETWSKWAGAGGSGESSRTQGAWKTEGGSIKMRPDGGTWQDGGRYEVSGSRLLVTSIAGKQVFERL